MINTKDFYWFVAGDQTKVYSSARNIYVDPATDADFLAWKNIGNNAGDTDSEAGIWHVMQDWMPLYLWDGTNFSQPAVNAWTKAQLRNYNATARLNKVNGGMTAAGVPVRTDDRSRGLIADGRALAMADSTYTTKWYGSDGLFYDVDAATMIQMSAKVAEHTNACYTVFEQTDAAITGNTITTLTQIDTAYAGL